VTFFYFQCSHCRTWAVTLKASDRVRCNGCGGTKAFKYTAHGDSQDVIDYCTRNGVAHLPLPQPTKLFPCRRCGERFRNSTMRLRPDGLVCRACYRSEERPPTPPPPHMTEQEDIDRMEAAYAAKETT
jgi:hypothetical protein